MPRGAGEIVMWLNNNKQSRKSTYGINESRIQYGHESAHWKLLSKQSQKVINNYVELKTESMNSSSKGQEWK